MPFTLHDARRHADAENPSDPVLANAFHDALLVRLNDLDNAATEADRAPIYYECFKAASIAVKAVLDQEKTALDASNKKLTADLRAARTAARTATSVSTPATAAPAPVVASPFSTSTASISATRWETSQYIMQRTNRGSLTAEERKALSDDLAKGIKNGFERISLDEIMLTSQGQKSILTATSTLVDCARRLNRKLQKHGAHEVFVSHDYASDNVTIIAVHDLFAHFGRVTPDSLRTTIANFHQRTTSESFSQDLFWSLPGVLDSINDPSLRTTVDDLITKEAPMHRVGPMALWHLFNTICSAEQSTLAHIKNHLYSSLSFDSVLDNNVELLVLEFEKSYQFLKAFGVNLDDANTAFKMILDKCPVADFRNHFKTLESIGDTRVDSIEATLAEARTKYNKMRIFGSWTAPKSLRKTGAAFKTSSTDDTSTSDDSKALVGSSRPPPLDKNGKPLPSHDRSGIPIDYTPPASGAPWNRTCPLTNRAQRWCPTCKRWGNHGGKGADEYSHADWDAVQKARRKKKKSDGSATASTTPPTPSPAPSPAPAPAPTIARAHLAQAAISGGSSPF